LILVVGVLAGNGVLDLDFPKIMRTAESIKKHAQWQAVAQKFSILAGHPHMFSIIYDAIPELREIISRYKSDPFNSVFGSAANGRALFNADAGYVGSCPRDCQEGDEVWIVKGGRVPYVLRPVEGTEGVFTFAGDCYVHGIMEGEYFQKSDCPFQWTEVKII
jgi:hypothetical protein